MYVPIFWPKRRVYTSFEDRTGRLRKILVHKGIDCSDDVLESALGRIPAQPAPELNIPAHSQSLQFPIGTSQKIAVLGGAFHADRNMRVLNSEDIEGLNEYAPDSLVIELHSSLLLADQIQRGLLQLSTVRHAIVILTTLADGPMADHHKELLWRAFRVPLFEQLCGWDGAVIARECEIHDGLHIDEKAAIFHLHDGEVLVTQLTCFDTPIVRARTGLTGQILNERCDCGAETARLQSLALVRSPMLMSTDRE